MLDPVAGQWGTDAPCVSFHRNSGTAPGNHMVLERGPFESWQGLVRAAGVVALLKLPNDPCRRTDAVPPGTGPILGQKKLPVPVARALHCRPPAGQPKSGDRQPALECEVTRHPSIGLWREHIFNVTPHALHKFIRCLNQLL